MPSVKFYSLLYSSLLLLTLYSCKTSYLTPTNHKFPDPVNTSSKPIVEQLKKTYTLDGVSVSNQFDGARLNGFEKINDTTYRAIITPENEPINESAYFCFELWSETNRNIDLELYYPNHEHRYIPKISDDGKTWSTLDSMDFDTLKGSDLATLRLSSGSDKKLVCAQELYTSQHNTEWIEYFGQNQDNVEISLVGQSKKGRDIHCMDIYEGSKKDKDAIVIFSRLHPPEVPGYLAMRHFVEEILADKALSNLFRKRFRILVYPMVNPDGVDMGHWRHNAGGIDLNRDWSLFNQEEPRVVATHCVKEIRSHKNQVLVGLDFHSTQEDILYTHTDNRQSSVFGFKDIWVDALKDGLPGHDPQDAPYDLNQPITKGWFFLEFNAEAITYEVGDETDRAFIDKKARLAAKEMMKLLVLRK